jgi:succinate dehydrogenase/fumarate reductase flavoprotein subunit
MESRPERHPEHEGKPMELNLGTGRNGVDLNEAARQLEQAAHDVRVAFDCIALDELDRAHTSTITARAAIDAAENVLRVALGGERSREPAV